MEVWKIAIIIWGIGIIVGFVLGYIDSARCDDEYFMEYKFTSDDYLQTIFMSAIAWPIVLWMFITRYVFDMFKNRNDYAIFREK